MTMNQIVGKMNRYNLSYSDVAGNIFTVKLVKLYFQLEVKEKKKR